MTTIYLRGGALLRGYLEPDVDEYTRRLDLDEPAPTLERVLEVLGIPEGLVAFGYADGRLLRLGDRLDDGLTLTLQTPAGGG